MTKIKRKISSTLLENAEKFRVLTLLGPRQAGKTTLVQTLFPQHTYANLEDPEQRSLANGDPKTFLKRFSPPAIIDEVQRVPDLLSYIQLYVDENPEQKGAYVLTGSHQPILKQEITQTLAGRTVIHTLMPLSMEELNPDLPWKKENEASQWIYRGFLPETFRYDLDPTQVYRSYYETYVERDVRQIIQIKDQLLFEKFIKLAAGRVGQILNVNSLSNDVGVSPKTISEWISVLEASFILFRLPPYFENFGKRLVKAPKIYFVDVGLASHLLGITHPDQVTRDPLFGSLFEGLVISELLKKRLNEGLPPELYFYRDSHGNEVDVLQKNGRQLTPIEIKAAATFHPSLLKNLQYFLKSVHPKSQRGALIYSGNSAPLSETVNGFHFKDSVKSI